MPRHPYQRTQGRIEYIDVSSTALAENMLGDPDTRTVAVYLPVGYDTTTEALPLMVDIAPFTGSGLGHLGWKAFQENIPQKLDRLIEAGDMGPVVVAFPDCFTSLGGNQYVNSVAMGNWETFLTVDLLNALESNFNILKGREHRALFGKSSGGYGSIVHGMLHADTWGAIACHSGDMDFEICYRADMPGLLRTLAPFDYNIRAYIDRIFEGRKVAGGQMHYLMIMAMAASYDPDPDAPYGVRLPVTTDTCEIIDERWQKWLEWDPVLMINRPEAQKNLASLNGLFIDCGDKDQYNLVYGARRLNKSLQLLGIDHRYEEFPDNHSSIDYRLDVSLPYLYAAISG